MQYVFLMGGWDGVSCNNDIAVYSPDGAPSGHMAPGARRMLSPRDALASVTVEHDVLALGGHDGSNYLASCEIYTASTPGTGRFPGWTLLPAMETTRAFHGAGAIRRKVFAFGGQGSKSGPAGAYGTGSLAERARTASVTSSLEILDLEGGIWVEGPALPSARTMVAGACSGERVFCVGGREGKFEEGDVLASALAYDPRTPTWEELPPLRHRRYGAGAVAMGGCVYVFGGKDEEVPLATVEVFDEVGGAWRESEAMVHERAFPCAVGMGAFIYVIAGSGRTDEVFHRSTHARASSMSSPDLVAQTRSFTEARTHAHTHAGTHTHTQTGGGRGGVERRLSEVAVHHTFQAPSQ